MAVPRHPRPVPTPDCVRRAALAGPIGRLGTLPPSPRKRDRHGRGMRGPLLFPALPGWYTRREQFYVLIQEALAKLAQRCPEIETVEFGVEEVPPSDPADWESREVILSRAFPRDRYRGISDRIVLYRLPIVQRATQEELPDVIHRLLAERICDVLAIDLDELLN